MTTMTATTAAAAKSTAVNSGAGDRSRPIIKSLIVDLLIDNRD